MKYHDLFIINYQISNKESKAAAEEAQKQLAALGVQTCMIGNNHPLKEFVQHIALAPTGIVDIPHEFDQRPKTKLA